MMERDSLDLENELKCRNPDFSEKDAAELLASHQVMLDASPWPESEKGLGK
jgi:hypothetical protein